MTRDNLPPERTVTHKFTVPLFPATKIGTKESHKRSHAPENSIFLLSLSRYRDIYNDKFIRQWKREREGERKNTEYHSWSVIFLISDRIVILMTRGLWCCVTFVISRKTFKLIKSKGSGQQRVKRRDRILLYYTQLEKRRLIQDVFSRKEIYSKKILWNEGSNQ